MPFTVEAVRHHAAPGDARGPGWSGVPAVAWRPTREQIAAAAGRTVRDVAAPGLDVLFVGINPGLYSGAVRHHFARPGNRFWKVLAGAGFTDRVLLPFEEGELLASGCGITNIVRRATASAGELSADELRAGARTLARKVRRLGPAFVAFLGLGAYRIALDRPSAAVGLQDKAFGGSRAWLLPNPSGLNAHYQLPELIDAFSELRRAAKPHRA
jgi:TDG/mug DNA glycosylase family protein